MVPSASAVLHLVHVVIFSPQGPLEVRVRCAGKWGFGVQDDRDLVSRTTNTATREQHKHEEERQEYPSGPPAQNGLDDLLLILTGARFLYYFLIPLWGIKLPSTNLSCQGAESQKSRVSLFDDCPEEGFSKSGDGECMTFKQCSVSSSRVFSNPDDPAAPYKALVQERFFNLLSIRIAAS